MLLLILLAACSAAYARIQEYPISNTWDFLAKHRMSGRTTIRVHRNASVTFECVIPKNPPNPYYVRSFDLLKYYYTKPNRDPTYMFLVSNGRLLLSQYPTMVKLKTIEKKKKRIFRLRINNVQPIPHSGIYTCKAPIDRTPRKIWVLKVI